MISRDFEHHRFYTQHGFETLNKIERLIQEGRVGDRLTPWINGTRTKFEEYQAEMKEALEEYEADKATKNVETGDKAPCDEGTEDGEIGEVEKVISSSTPAIKFSQEVSLAQGSKLARNQNPVIHNADHTLSQAPFNMYRPPSPPRSCLNMSNVHHPHLSLLRFSRRKMMRT